MNVYVVGVNAGNPSGLLASAYMEKEMRVLGYEPQMRAIRDASDYPKALNDCAQPGALILCPLSGSVQRDFACIKAIAELCGTPLEPNETVQSNLVKRQKLSSEQARQFAQLPHGARIFTCRQSPLPGFEIAGKEFHIVALPSDTEEQTSLFFSYLFQILKKAAADPCAVRVARVMELNASQVEQALGDLLQQKSPCVAVYSKRSEVIVRICDNDPDRAKAAQRTNAALQMVQQRLGDCVYGIDVNSIEHAVMAKCAQKNICIAFAESGSSGLSAKRFLNADKEGKLVASTYSCRPEKMDLERLGINDKIGSTFGPVSANVAAAMALGASKKEEKDLMGLSITLPDAAVKTRKAYIAAVLNGVCLLQELDAGNYRSLTQMTSDAVAKLFNLARKMVDSYPQAPQSSCGAEEAVLQGMEVVPSAGTAAVAAAAAATDAPSGKKHRGKKAKGKTDEEPTKTSKAPKGFKGILYRIFPNKDDVGFDKVRKILLWVCLLVFAGSMFYLIDFGAQNKKSQENLATLQSQMEQAEKDVADGKINVSNIEGYPNDYLAKFYPFYLENEDIKGWLQIEGTNVNFPVVQTSDNDYYHRLGFNKEYDYYGTPYIDYECDVKTPSTNIIIYGHNIRNDGQMFNDLTKYKQLSYYKEHPLIDFDSVYKEGEYKIFAAFITNTLAEHDNGNVFEYTHFVNAENEEEFNEFVDEVKRRSIFDTPVDVEYGDELLTLSTCTYEFKEARFVVVARRVRDGEDSKVDVDQAVANDDAYYPAVYAGAADYAKKLGQVKSITIDGSREVELEVGGTVTLTASVSPADAEIKTCTWDSSNTSVATVDKNSGLVTAVGAGTTQITASADDGGYVDNITVKVTGNGAQLTGIKLSSQSMNLQQGGAQTLTATLEPADAQASLSWKSSDDSIVRIEGDGTSVQLNGVNTGTATITVTSSDGKISASCAVTVSGNSADHPGIVFAQTSLSLSAGQSQSVRLTVTPSGADVGDISWSASGSAISIPSGVSGTEITVTAKQAGQSVLTATTADGQKASCTITVGDAASTQEQTGSVSLTINPLTLNPGEEGQLQYNVNPTGTKLTWTSSNPRVADVDQNGYVTTIISLSQTTSVTITATAPDGTTYQTTVTVIGTGGSGSNTTTTKPENNTQTQQPDSNSEQSGSEGDLGLYSEQYEVEVESGYTKLLPLHVDRPEGDVIVECSSSNRGVAQVDDEGMVTGVGPGSATITITATDVNTGERQTITVSVSVSGGGGYGTNTQSTGEEGETTGGSSFGYGTSN